MIAHIVGCLETRFLGQVLSATAYENQMGLSPFLGRGRAGTRPALTVVTGDGCAARRGWATGGTDSTPATRRQRGMVSGGRCGGNPPAHGRAEGPTAQLQWLVVSDQWSEGTALAMLGDVTWL